MAEERVRVRHASDLDLVDAGEDWQTEYRRKDKPERREKREAMSHLTDAKDRAQFSSATAMSILDVGILGDVILKGAGYSMFVPLVVMVTAALILQVTIGALSLMISHMKGHYVTFKRDTGTCMSRMKCWREDPEDGTWEVSPGADVTDVVVVRPGSDGVTCPDEMPLMRIGLDSTDAQTPPNGRANHCPSFDADSTRSQIYGNGDTDPIRIRSPRDGDNRVKAQCSSSSSSRYEDKMVARLQSWVDHMADEEETRVETRMKIRFVKREISARQAELDQLNLDLHAVSNTEKELFRDRDAAVVDLAKLASKVDPAQVAEVESKRKDIERNIATTDDAAQMQSLVKELNQELVPLYQKLESANIEVPDYARVKDWNDDVEFRLVRHFENKKRVNRNILQKEHELMTRRAERGRLLKQQREFEIKEEKLHSYRQSVRRVQKVKVLKRVMYWQNIINYMLYFLFILNTFITVLTFLSVEN